MPFHYQLSYNIQLHLWSWSPMVTLVKYCLLDTWLNVHECCDLQVVLLIYTHSRKCHIIEKHGLQDWINKIVISSVQGFCTDTIWTLWRVEKEVSHTVGFEPFTALKIAHSLLFFRFSFIYWSKITWILRCCEAPTLWFMGKVPNLVVYLTWFSAQL